jgi:hypothetical protein
MQTDIIEISDPSWHSTLEKLDFDVYHLPAYLSLEATRTNSHPEAFLLKDKERIFFVPYLLRKYEELVFDIISPYGYPGILLNQAAIDSVGFPDFALEEFKKNLAARGACSAFFRLHPILNQGYDRLFAAETLTKNGETVSIDLTLTESEIWAHTRKGHQSTINKGKRLGLVGKMLPLGDYLTEFINIYEETMDRVAAQKSYYFGRDYFEGLLELGERVHLGAIEAEGKIVCASLFFECCGIVQAHLGGTKTEFLKQSPFNLLLHYVRLWAKERGNKFLHIGGGVGGSTEDKLHTFKTGFSRQRHEFFTLRLITDESKYNYLVEARANLLQTSKQAILEQNFFPAYRYTLKNN